MATVADLFAKLGLKPDKSSFTAGQRLISGVKKAIVGLVAIKTVQWFKGVINEVADASDQFAKLSQQINIPTEGIQQLAFAAKLSGVELGALVNGVAKFNENIIRASEGGKDQISTFKQLGVDYKALAAGTITVEEAILQAADGFKALPNGALKSSLAMRAFSKTGRLLLPLLNTGRAGVQELKDEFVALGAQIDGKTAAAFEVFNDDQVRIGTIWQGIKNQFVVGLLPTLQAATTRILDFAKQNKDLIKQKIAKFLEKFIKGVKILTTIVKRFVGVGEDFLDVLIKFDEEGGDVVKTLMLIVGGLIALKVAALAAAVAGALIASPFLLVAAVVVAIGIAVAKSFGIEPLELFARTLKVIKVIVEGIAKILRSVGEGIGEAAAKAAIALGIIDPQSEASKSAKQQSQLRKLTDKQINDEVTISNRRGPGGARNKLFKAEQVRRGRQEVRALFKRGRDVISKSGGITSSTVNAAPTFNLELTVNNANGTPEAISKKVKKEVETFWDSKMRHAQVAQ